MITSVKISGGCVRFYSPSPLLIARAVSMLTKETDTIRWIDGFEGGDVFWDLGANVGVYSLYAALRKGIQVVSFEPCAANYHVLTKNVELNAVADRVRAYCLAFCERTQLGVLNIPSQSMGSSLSQFGKPGDRSRYYKGPSQPAIHGMLGFSIDDFVSLFSPSFPTHLKIDVDGLEVAILRSARKTLRDARIKSLLVELSTTDDQEKLRASSILDEAGFRLVSRGDVDKSDGEQCANHIFERSPSRVVVSGTDLHPLRV
jgi:FkbM family methyltransferase